MQKNLRLGVEDFFSHGPQTLCAAKWSLYSTQIDLGWPGARGNAESAIRAWVGWGTELFTYCVFVKNMHYPILASFWASPATLDHRKTIIRLRVVQRF